MSQTFQATGFSEVNFPSSFISPHTSHLPQVGWRLPLSQHYLLLLVMALFWEVEMWIWPPEWNLCWTLNFHSQKCNYTKSNSYSIHLLRAKNEAIISTQRDNLGIWVGLRALGDVLQSLIGPQVRQAVGDKGFQKYPFISRPAVIPLCFQPTCCFFWILLLVIFMNRIAGSST